MKAVCMNSVYMTALYVSGLSAYITPYVLDFNYQDRNEDVCNLYDCSVCSCSVQDVSVYSCMYMTAVFMYLVYLAALSALNEAKLWGLQYSRQKLSCL